MFPSTFHPNNAARAHWLVQIPWKCNLGYIPAGWSVATVNPAFLLDAAHWTFSPPTLFPCCSHRIPVLVPALVSYLVLRTEWKLFGKAKSKTLPSTFLINVHFFFLFFKIYLVTPGLSCGTQDLWSSFTACGIFSCGHLYSVEFKGDFQVPEKEPCCALCSPCSLKRKRKWKS